MKKVMSLALLCSMVIGLNATDVVGTAEEEKCCSSPCNTCPTTTNTGCCKTELTAEEEAAEAAAEAERCACSGKPAKPTGREVGAPEDEKCCNPCNTCPTTTTNTGCCKTESTAEEDAEDAERCPCNKPKPGNQTVATIAVAQATANTNND